MGKNRLGLRLANQFKALFGTPAQRRLAWAALQVDRIRYWETEASKLSDAEIEKQINEGRKADDGQQKMPAFKGQLTDEETKALIAYVKSFRK